MMTFFEFLTKSRSSDAVGDLGREVANDERAPRATAALTDYLNRRGVDSDIVDEALARRGGRVRSARS